MRYLEFSEVSDVCTYEYGGGYHAIGISSKADHKLAGMTITDIFDVDDLKEYLTYLAGWGLKVPHH
jgi:hypothetical protein